MVCGGLSYSHTADTGQIVLTIGPGPSYPDQNESWRN